MTLSSSLKLIKAVLSAAFLYFSSTQISLAETLAIPLGEQGKAWNVEAPKAGWTKSDVEARYGQPVKRMGPIGDPPIYAWDYDQFTVYFEGNVVLHSVVKYDPATK